ncbi:MAG: hypothetical protein GEU90_10985 [Gemmatimonas sp.]|nr:hypothetical protein [Gemmatimonas sp.]
MMAAGNQPGAKAGTRGWRRLVVVGLLLLFPVTGCDALDELISVDLPGDMEEGDLDDPRLAEVLVNSAQADFECAFPRYVRQMGIWTLKIQDGGQGRPSALNSIRSSSYAFYADHCTGTEPNWAPLQTSRAQAARAVRLIEGFPEGSVENRAALLGRSRLYEAYSILLLSEAYCGVTVDLGPLLTRAEGFTIAEDRFTDVLEYAVQVADPEMSSYLTNSALIGRARARLNLGDRAGVVEDASRVEEDFVFYSTHDDVPNRRTNNLYEYFIIGTSGSIGVKYRPLRFLEEGVLDPRVPIVETNRVTGGGANIIWEPRFWQSEGDDLRVGTWREAQMMIAEVEGGQTAVNIINRLRSDYDLPTFSSTDPAEITAQVREERMRETFLQGTEVGDLLRWGGPWPTGFDERGRAIDEANTCVWIPDYEVIANPNLRDSPTTPL